MALPVVNAPKYQLTIPSNGQNISYRPYLVKEEKILMIALESKDQAQMIQAVKDVIKACTHDSLDNIETLPMFDIEYLFLKIRSKSVGETSDVRVKCSACEKFNDISVNLEKAEVTGEIKKDYKVSITDTVGVVLKYPSVKSIQKNLHSSKGDQLGVALDTVAASIDSIYDENSVFPAENETHESLITFLESLNSEQFKKISKFYEEMPAVRSDASFDCVHCQTHNDVTLEGLQSFF